MKNLLFVISLGILLFSCKRKAHNKLDLSKIQTTASTSFSTYNFENLKSVVYRESGENLKKEILNIWNSEELFIGEENAEKKGNTSKNLILTLRKADRVEKTGERNNRTIQIFETVKRNILNINNFQSVIIKYDTELSSGERIESNKNFNIK